MLLGAGTIALAVWVGVQEARLHRLEGEIETGLGLPAEAFSLEQIEPDSSLRVRLRRVAILDAAGDTVLAAPELALAFDPRSLAGTGPIELRGVRLRHPTVRLVQHPDGSWNAATAVRVQAAGRDIAPGGPGEKPRELVFRDLRIDDARVQILLPYVAAPRAEGVAARFAMADPTRLVRRGRVRYRVRELRDLDARIPELRTGGGAFRVRIASFSARLTDPALRIRELQGTLSSAANGSVRWAVSRFRTDHSRLRTSGVLQLSGGVRQMDARLHAERLDLEELRAVAPGLPAGEAAFALRVQGPLGGRLSYDFTGLRLDSEGSRLRGRLGLLAGGGQPAALRDTRLQLDPLQLRSLERLGFAETLPVLGEVRGTIATPRGETVASTGRLVIDLSARLVARGAPGAEPSLVEARGPLAFGPAGLRLDGVRVQAAPLRLATLRTLLPRQVDLLLGTVRGVARLEGTPQALRISDGDLVYAVGDAPPTRVRALSGTVAMGAAFRYDLRGTADPLSLATLSELFPSLPVRRVALGGVIAIAGDPERVRFDLDLRGAPGRIALQGTATLGETLGFDVAGRLTGFRAGALLAANLPLEGPVSGTFSARGVATDFRFTTDLAQGGGSFALGGRVRRPVGRPALFDVAGQVRNFRIGALLGQPELFPSPFTGRLALNGGGGQPLRFDVDLVGAGGLLDLRGYYLAGAVPAYAASGRVQGLNLRRLLGGRELPETRLTATLELEGRGLTAETVNARLALVAQNSTVATLPLDATTIRVAAANGVLQVDTATIALGGSRLQASGAWGLTRPLAEPLRFSFVSPDLRQLAPVLRAFGQNPTQEFAGAVRLDGSVAGSLQRPQIVARADGQALRWGEIRIGTLTLETDLVRRDAAWNGATRLQLANAVLPAVGDVTSARLDLTATPSEIAFAFNADRPDAEDIAASARLEIVDRRFRAALVEQFALRLQGTRWELVQPARVRWGGVTGIEVAGLALRQTEGGAGEIGVDGRLPPSGRADLRVQARNFELGQLRRFVPLPELAGTLSFDAVVEGPTDRPNLRADLRVDSLRVRGVPANQLRVGLRYADRRLIANGLAVGPADTIAVLNATVPALLTLAGAIPRIELLRTEPLQGRLRTDSLPLALVIAAIPGIRQGAGIVQAELTAEGTLARPRLTGIANVIGGAVTVDAARERFRDIEARLVLQGDQIAVNTLQARSASTGGVASVSGTVGLREANRPVVDLGLELRNFRIANDEEVAELTASGDLQLRGRFPSPVLTGRLVLDEGIIRVPELADRERRVALNDVEVGQVGADSASTEVLRSRFAALGDIRVEQVQIETGEGIWLESEDLRVQIATTGGPLLVSRFGREARISGRLEAQRGTYRLQVGPLQREFDLVSGNVQFFGTPDLNPGIAIRAANEVRALDRGGSEVLTIFVDITGTLENLEIRLTSDTRPPLPESELLSYLVFGRPSFGLEQGARSFAQELIAQELVGNLLAAQIENALAGSFFEPDYVRVRTRPGRLSELAGATGFTSLVEATTVEIGEEANLITDDFFVTTEFAVGGLLGFGGLQSFFRSLGGEYQQSERNSYRLLFERAQQEEIFGGLPRRGPRNQISAEWRRRWEFGRPPAPRVPTRPARRTPARTEEGGSPQDAARPAGQPSPRSPGSNQPAANPPR